MKSTNRLKKPPKTNRKRAEVLPILVLKPPGMSLFANFGRKIAGLVCFTCGSERREEQKAGLGLAKKKDPKNCTYRSQ